MRNSVLLVMMLLMSWLSSAQDIVRITQDHKDRAAQLMSGMTLEQKCHVISGLSGGAPGNHSAYMLEGCPELGVPSIVMGDGPQGINSKTNRDQRCTYYACGVSAAASFDRDAVFGMGDGLGLDARARGVGFLLGPGVNIYRVPLCGRNFEYFGEDPFLAGEIAVSYTKGVQKHGVIATVKHFAVNNQEWDRFIITSNVDERTLNEIYFPAFRKAIQEGGAGAVMTACGRLNGLHCSENPYLLKQTLRDDWGFDGVSMCDWQTMFSTLNGIMGGNDIEMPQAYVHDYNRVKRLIDIGVLNMKDIDEKCQNVLQTLIAFGLLDRPLKDETIPFDNPQCHQWAYESAVGGPVLVKNNGMLPIKKSSRNKILMTGPYADEMVAGGGSGWVKPFDGAYVTTYKGMSNLGKGYDVMLADEPTDEQVKEASAVIVEVGFGRRIERENFDHTFALPDAQEELIRRLVGLSDKVIVVVHSGCEVDMREWHDKAAAVIYAWYGGEHTGTVLSEIIAGKVSPSGRLPFTMWGSFENNPCSETYLQDDFLAKSVDRPRFTQCPHVDYKEGVFVGYRGIERFDRKPLYPFGYGLSYASFEFSDLSVAPSGDGYDVTFTVKNTGKMPASQVAQIYVSPVEPSLPRPVRELKQFTKVKLDKGESKTVTLHLDRSAFEHFDVFSHGWVADKGEYRIQLGDNSQNILLETSVVL
jgi:beta-glucosidase